MKTEAGILEGIGGVGPFHGASDVFIQTVEPLDPGPTFGVDGAVRSGRRFD